MIDWFAQFLIASGKALTSALAAVAIPAVFFLLLALILKRGRLLSDIKRVLPETKINLLLLAFNVVFVAPLIATASTLLTALFQGWTILDANVWASLPLPVVATLAIVIGDLTGYWRHRFEHTPPLWPAHAIHHSDTQMTWLAIERFHPINRITTFVIDSTVLTLLGFPPYALVANSLMRHYYGAFIHSDLPWTYGPLGKVFVSPAMHHWHHAADEKAIGSNFATVFAVWDRLFGTFHLPGPCNSRLGVDDPIGMRLTEQLVWPFQPRHYRNLFPRPVTQTS